MPMNYYQYFALHFIVWVHTSTSTSRILEFRILCGFDDTQLEILATLNACVCHFMVSDVKECEYVWYFAEQRSHLPHTILYS